MIRSLLSSATPAAASALLMLAIGVLLLAPPQSAQAQYNIAQTYSQPNSLAGSQLFPSKLDLRGRKFQVGIGNTNSWLGNNIYTFEDVVTILNEGTLTSSQVDELVDNGGRNNVLGVGFQSRPLTLTYGFQDRKNRRYAVGFFVGVQAKGVAEFSEDFLRLAWEGNQPYAGEELELEAKANAHALVEYGLAFSMPLFGDNEAGALRLGARARLLQATQGVETVAGEGNLFTSPDGRFINFRHNYDFRMSNIAETDYDNIDVGDFTNWGYGFDLGATYWVTDNIIVSASLTDLGAINFTNNVVGYQGENDTVYEGLFISNFFGDDDLEGVDPNYLFDTDTVEGGSFRQVLGAKLALQGEYNIIKETNRKGYEYVRAAVFGTYVQGLNNQPGATTRPFASVGGLYNFGGVFTLGGNLSYGGFNDFTFGLFTNLRTGPFELGFGSDNLLPLFVTSSGSGVDFMLQMTFTFGSNQRERADRASQPESL